MNAGCYGGETWDIVRRVVTVDRQGELHERTRAHYRIGYRTVVRDQPIQIAGSGARALEEWFVAAVFALPRGDGTQSRSKVKEPSRAASRASRSASRMRAPFFATRRGRMQQS